MKIIDIESIEERFHTIDLQNGKQAKLFQVILTRVPDINKEEDIYIYKYKVPCPLCNEDVIAFSYDGIFFGNIQINCKYCGIYFRPVVKRG